MADKKDSPAKGSPNEAAGGSGKKPQPLLDLKATEVRGPSASDKSSSESKLKGAPGYKEPEAKPSEKGSASDKPATAASPGSGAASVPPTSKAASQSTSSSGTPDVKATSAKSPEGTKSGSGAGSQSGSKSGSPPPKSPEAGPAAAAAAPQPRAKSGGGFFSTLSHMVAAVIGGGIALFAAEPVSKELGIQLTSPPAELTEMQSRLAALETKSAAPANQRGLADDVSQLSAQLTSTKERVSKLEALGKEVASLSDELKKVQEAAAAAPKDAGQQPSGEEAASIGDLRTRLSKLESALSTLSSATGEGGAPAAIAPAAQFSAKLADLESSVNTQLGSLRKSLMAELDKRITSTTSSTAKAVAGAERLDREVSDIKNETARLEQRSTVLKVASDKLSASLRAVSEQAAELKVELDALKGEVKQEFGKVARPGDVKQALEPVATKVASIEKNLASVLDNENARKQNAERIVLSLELSNLKRVLDRGAPFAAELADVKKIAGGEIDFASLEAFQSKGVPSSQALTRQFSDVAYKIINADGAPKEDASPVDRLFAAAKSIVQVRRTDLPAKDSTAEAAVARIEGHLKAGDMSAALEVAEKLPDAAKKSAADWLRNLAARAQVDREIAKIENQLKSSLGGGASSKDKS